MITLNYLNKHFILKSLYFSSSTILGTHDLSSFYRGKINHSPFPGMYALFTEHTKLKWLF